YSSRSPRRSRSSRRRSPRRSPRRNPRRSPRRSHSLRGVTMKKRLAITAISTGLLVLSSGAALAAPALRIQVNQKGDFALIGNTLGQDCAATVPPIPLPVLGTVGNCGLNTGDSAPDIFWRSDQPAAGQAQANNTITVAQARTTAVLNLPAGATITHAFVYWAATLAAAGTGTTATLDRPGV